MYGSRVLCPLGISGIFMQWCYPSAKRTLGLWPKEVHQGSSDTLGAGGFWHAAQQVPNFFLCTFPLRSFSWHANHAPTCDWRQLVKFCSRSCYCPKALGQCKSLATFSTCTFLLLVVSNEAATNAKKGTANSILALTVLSAAWGYPVLNVTLLKNSS